MAGGVHFGIRVRTGLLVAALGVVGSELDLTGTKLVLTGSGTDFAVTLLAGKVFDGWSSALECVLVLDGADIFGCTGCLFGWKFAGWDELVGGLDGAVLVFAGAVLVVGVVELEGGGAISFLDGDGRVDFFSGGVFDFLMGGFDTFLFWKKYVTCKYEHIST